jgi:glycosyltransferase involved in cell wall biosynthesis
MSANGGWNILNFRAGLVRALIADGHEVIAAAGDDGTFAKLQQLGVRPVALPIAGAGTSILQDVRLFVRYWRLMRRERPDVFLGWTIKPNIYGSLAAACAGVPRINNISGLGTAFIRRSWLTMLVSFLYRLALRGSSAVLFQNEADRALFIERAMVRPAQTRLLPGSGIDTGRFDPSAYVAPTGCPVRFLLVGRLIRDKGVLEYVEAARLLKRRHSDARFQILGFLDVPNRTAIGRVLLQQWIDEGVIDYLGTAEDVRPAIASADCIVLPSYREGLSRVLLEAAAMARPAIATDVPGCRDTIVDGRTGFLCRPRDSLDLANKMEAMLLLSSNDRQAMGCAGRLHIEANFHEKTVIDGYRQAIDQAILQNDRKV